MFNFYNIMEKINKYLTRTNFLHFLAYLAVYNYAVKPLVRSLSFIYKQWLRPRYNLIQRYGEDSWAVITGSTNGIG